MADYAKRGKNSWRLTVSLGNGPGNKKIRERTTIRVEDPKILNSPRKLEQHLEEEWLKFKIEVETGAYITPDKMKFSDFVDEWREKYASNPSNLSPTTLKCYEDYISSRLIPAFGHMQIDQITAMQIVTFLSDLEKPGARLDGSDKPLEQGTIGYIYRVLKNIFTRAVDWKVIKENPMEGIAKPKEKDAKQKYLEQKINPQFYDEEEAQRVVDCLYKETLKWRLLILGSMIGGWRRGELIGLEWHNVDFENRILTVENNIPLTKDGEAVEKGPKSFASYRDVDMPEWYMNDLSLYRQEWLETKDKLGDKWLGENREYVFHNGKGKPYYYQHPYKWWKRFCLRHKIRFIKFHGLRHSMGTLMLEDETEANFDSVLIAVQRRLGHSRLSTSADVYTHISKKVKRRTTSKFDKFSRQNI